MDLYFVGLLLEIGGNFMLVLSIVMVHSKIQREHKIDRAVLREMSRENVVVVCALAMLAVGYMLQLMHFGYITW